MGEVQEKRTTTYNKRERGDSRDKEGSAKKYEGIVNYNSLQLLNMLCELSLLFNKKQGVEEQFPEDVGNSHYEYYGFTLIRGNNATSGRQIVFDNSVQLILKYNFK